MNVWAHTQIQIIKYFRACSEISVIICNLRVSSTDKGFATNFCFPDSAFRKFMGLAFFPV